MLELTQAAITLELCCGHWRHNTTGAGLLWLVREARSDATAAAAAAAAAATATAKQTAAPSNFYLTHMFIVLRVVLRSITVECSHSTQSLTC